jgi:hypothetical protein
VDVLAMNGYPSWHDKTDPKMYWYHFVNNLYAEKPPAALGKTFLISETGLVESMNGKRM